MRQVVVSGDGPWIEVRQHETPFLFGALAELSGAAGHGSQHSSYSIHRKWQEALPLIERSLAGLSVGDRSTFVHGEVTAREAISAGSVGLMFAHNLLTDFVEE